MRLRRSFALFAGASLLATGLSSCGFDKATDRVSTPGEGTNNRDATVDVLSALIVSAQDDSGTFIVTLSNNDRREPLTFEALAPAAEEGAIEVAAFDAVEIAPQGFVNLANDDRGVIVEGDFTAGQFLPMVLTFDNGETVELDVPVVRACESYEGLDLSASEAPAETEEVAAEEETEGEEPELPSAYSCDYPEGVELH